MSQPVLKTVQVSISQLKLIHSALSETLGPAEHDLQATCVSCGIRLSRDDLREVASVTASHPNPKLRRIQLEYCARNGCDGRFYLISTSSKEASEVVAAMTNTLPRITGSRRMEKRTPQTVLKVLLVLIILGFSFFIADRLYNGKRIPLLQERHDYRT
jgi:hypothetical protein